MGALGCRGHGKHKKKNVSRDHLGPHRSGFGSYGRGNFPGHNVLGGLLKNDSDMGTDDYTVDRFGWVWMHAWARREAKTRQKDPQTGELECYIH